LIDQTHNAPGQTVKLSELYQVVLSNIIKQI